MGDPGARRKSALRRILITSGRLICAWLVMFMVVALSVEGVSRLMFQYVPPSPRDYRGMQPAAYQGAPYFSQAFLDEAFSHQNWINPPNTRIIYPGDYQGHWFNVADGVRRTTESARSDRRILLVGSSTVYNAEVPDDFTIASYLQRLLNRANADVAVLNLGASGVKVSQQLERLRTLATRPRDVVLFYDGSADAMQGVFYANFDGWIVGQNRKYLDNIVARNRVTIEALARRSRFFDWLYAETTNYLPEHLKDPARIKSLAIDTRDQLLRDLIETDHYVRSKQAIFIHVLQPDLFSKPSLRDFEIPLIENHFLTMNGVGPAFLAAHKEFSSLTQSLRSNHIAAYDATALFNGVEAPIYLDFGHTNQLGNKLIADFLYDVLRKEQVIADPG
jgi:hypothetical protein